MKILIVTNQKLSDGLLETGFSKAFDKASNSKAELINYSIDDINTDNSILNNFNIIFCFSNTKDTIISLFQHKKNIPSFETSFNPFYDKQINLLISGVSFDISELETTSIPNKKLAWSLIQDTIELGKNLIDLPITPIFESNTITEFKVDQQIELKDMVMSTDLVEKCGISLIRDPIYPKNDIKIIIDNLQSIVDVLKKYTS